MARGRLPYSDTVASGRQAHFDKASGPRASLAPLGSRLCPQRRRDASGRSPAAERRTKWRAKWRTERRTERRLARAGARVEPAVPRGGVTAAARVGALRHHVCACTRQRQMQRGARAAAAVRVVTAAAE